ncbi:MAG: hypothetical protein FD120_2590 [Gammaproteobacteria bacterium]|nr:MAG: hypothetical protein FD120_2590 [Gammaproteobacteria bacterium]
MTFTTAATDTLAAVQVYAANYRELPISVTRPTAVIPAKARLHGGRRGAAEESSALTTALRRQGPGMTVAMCCHVIW